MLPSRPETQPSKARELLEAFGSALFDDEDPEEQGLIRPRRRDQETPRQRYVRDMETRWAEFHRAEAVEGETFIGLIIYWAIYMAIPLAIIILIALARWIGDLSNATQWEAGGALSLIYIAWILRRRGGQRPTSDD